ncbi:hypothetical protein V8G54_032840 [Vigna mungo]|uniref:Uncharacterized protein n=1 Tax=Vigna mungo TaxID=3915 RepID=A0AAQ3MM90_VIGMU
MSTIEGNDTQGQTTRAPDVFEVQNIKGSTKVHTTVNNLEENAIQGFKTWQQKSKNLSWKNLATTLLRIVEGNKRSMLCESWTAVTRIGSVAILRENLKVNGVLGNKGAATAESVVATRTDEVRDVNLRISQNWAKRIKEEWKSLEEDLLYRPPPSPQI